VRGPAGVEVRGRRFWRNGAGVRGATVEPTAGVEGRHGPVTHGSRGNDSQSAVTERGRSGTRETEGETRTGSTSDEHMHEQLDSPQERVGPTRTSRSDRAHAPENVRESR